MIDLYYWSTPNGHKITMFLEEAGLGHRIHPVDIGAGDQFKPDFLAISPNNRIPAIIDHDGPGGKDLALFGLLNVQYDTLDGNGIKTATNTSDYSMIPVTNVRTCQPL